MKKCEGGRHSKRNAEAGTYRGQPTYCPVNCQTEEDCPYAYKGRCHIEDPFKDCDDWWVCGAENWDEWEAL